ncbi:MAG TPA: hypothetical protein VKD91_04545 [Pyrinomonadaceae bacterium]|nr:hypothetical protein [Pyrinomonadaceae bacterium]
MSFERPLFYRRVAPIFLSVALAAGLYFTSTSQAEQAKEVTAEQVAESAIAMAGNGFGRAVLSQIRRNGLEIGRETKTKPDGRSEETRYERRFVYGEKPEKDKFRLDSKTPSAEFSLVYGEGRLFGIINGATFTPRPDTAADFISNQAHSIDALLRYKENESKLTSAGKDKQQGVDLYVLDLVDKANRKTRFFVSAKTFRILSLEYEETPPGGSTPVKYTKRFYDYRVAQGTQVPYRTVLLEDGKPTTETHILTITYGVKMDDALFKNPEAATASGNP